MATPTSLRQFYVDESGDLTLFNKRGASIVGNEGVSKFFMLGVVHLPDPGRAEKVLGDLRRDLLADPYFRGVPSMQVNERKTALHFHAKDDLPEVRREVFRVLVELGAFVQVVVRRKSVLAIEGRALFQRGLKLRPDEIYHEMVRGLFRNLESGLDVQVVIFAQRGKDKRLVALTKALSHSEGEKLHLVEISGRISQGGNIRRKVDEVAKLYADALSGQPNPPSTPSNARTFQPRVVSAAFPHQFAGLQVVDYYLWALQRMYERREERFFNLLASNYRLIIDLDDKRNNPSGEFYTESNPLNVNKMMPEAS